MFNQIKKVRFYLKQVSTLILIFLIFTNCESDDSLKENADDNIEIIDYREEMRNFVKEISVYSKSKSSGFIIIPQNGQELITDTGESDGIIQTDYLNSIDATGREDLFYGYNLDNMPTPLNKNEYMLSLCEIYKNNGVEVLTTDYCSSTDKIDDSYLKNYQNSFISFAADDRELSKIPDYPLTPYSMNNNDITQISDAANFLYLINTEKFSTKGDFINAVSQTNYDLIIMDLFHNGVIYTIDEINSLKTKQAGGKRLIICYISIGEAEDYRYYWQDEWKIQSPDWLEKENPDWEGNFKVKYWDDHWKTIIINGKDSYLSEIISAGFDGVYLDIIDAFEYFE